MRGLIETSLLEWENTISAVVIAGGCNLRCPFCHSWRYVTGLEILDRLDPQALFSLLERQRGWIDGVVFTGGEPTLQAGLAEMIRAAREYGVKIKLHTNGTRPEILAGLLDEKLVDCLALDYKAPLDSRYFKAAGIPDSPGVLEAVKQSFALAAGSSAEREYHTTLVPQIIDLPGFVRMAEDLEPDGLWILQQFENGDCLQAGFSGGARYDTAMLDAFAAAAGEKHPRVLLRRGSSA